MRCVFKLIACIQAHSAAIFGEDESNKTLHLLQSETKSYSNTAVNRRRRWQKKKNVLFDNAIFNTKT